MLVLFFFFSPSSTPLLFFFFFFNDTATTEIYTLSLHDALPISGAGAERVDHPEECRQGHQDEDAHPELQDRKSTRLNSSHLVISYAVFCLKKKKKKKNEIADKIQSKLTQGRMKCNETE